jgi:phosphate transport system substrate-binding protein
VGGINLKSIHKASANQTLTIALYNLLTAVFRFLADRWGQVGDAGGSQFREELMRGLKIRGLLLALSIVAFCTSCLHRAGNGSSIKVTGSDTMINLAAAWLERYQSVNPHVSIQVKGGGSGVGFAALCSGKVDIATASRPIKPLEIQLAKKNTGKEPKEYVVGRDALAIYVHLDNPLETITIPQLAEIYGEGGKITKWSDLAIDNNACAEDEIIRVSRQNNSGTYEYFKEAVLGRRREYKAGATSGSGSSDVVALVSKTPCAIG